MKENVKQKRAHLVRCGQCINCKIHRAREWTNRLVDEATQYSDISIIVLTYDNEHIRWGEKTRYGRYGTLWHEDVQNYIKKVKMMLDRQYKKGKIGLGEATEEAIRRGEEAQKEWENKSEDEKKKWAIS